MWEFDVASGRWTKDGQISASSPPVGAPFWTRNADGKWEFETFTNETDPSRPPGGNVGGPPVEVPRIKGGSTGYGNDDQARQGKPNTVTVPVASDSSPGPANPTPPTPAAPTPTNPNPRLVDGRLSRERIAAGGPPPPGVSASSWADIQAGTYSPPPRNSGSPGGPTDEFGTLLNAPDPGEAPAYPLFERNKFDQNFKAVDGNSFDGPNNNNFSTQLLASIQEMIDRNRPSLAGPASDADMRESNRAQFIMNALSSGRDMNDPFSPQLSSSNAIDNAGEMFDRQEAIQKSKAQRKAWEAGDTENMNPRLSAAKNAPKGWEPTDEEPTYVPDPEDDKSKKGRTSMYTRRFAMGTAPNIFDVVRAQRAGDPAMADAMTRQALGKPFNVFDVTAAQKAGRADIAGRMQNSALGKGWNPAPAPTSSSDIARAAAARNQAVMNAATNPAAFSSADIARAAAGLNQTVMNAATMAPRPIPPSRPAYARRYSYGTGGAGSPPATFR